MPTLPRLFAPASLLALGGLLLAAPAPAQTIPVHALTAAPTIDGQDADWQAITAETVPLAKNKADGATEVASIRVKAGTFGDEVFFCLQWADDDADTEHKPFVWDAAKNKYESSSQMEDRLALEFEMAGSYDANWFSGKEFTADQWHWKAARTNPLGLAHDKVTIITRSEQKKSYKAELESGPIYILRPSDEGPDLYTTMRYSQKQAEVMPKYGLNYAATGSIADIAAKGAWADNTWTLELRRKLDTGHADDVVFTKGKAVPGAIAVFDQTGDDDHTISDTLTFQF